jgi:hypothetical protein
LGQEKSVKVLFPVYADTMESAALALMGRKMQAALLLYGDNAASAITDEAGGSGNDFAAELAARILDGDELSSDGITGLLKYTIIEDEEPLWNSLDDEQDLVVIDGAQNTESVQATTEGEVTQAPEVQTYEQFVRSWESWVGNQADYITRSLERAAKKRGRRKVSEHQLALFSLDANDQVVSTQLTLF